MDQLREKVNSKVAESGLPSEKYLGYKSTIKFYGGKLIEDQEGNLVYDMTGPWSRIDQKGDRVLRTHDEHHAKEPLKMLARHPKSLIKTLPFFADAKRYKGNAEELLANIKRLGLEEYYGYHEKGVKILKRELFEQGISFQDIYRQDLINSKFLNKFDRFDATEKAGAYLDKLHKNYGAVGEYNIYPIIFSEHDQNKVDNPVLMLPAIMYNSEKKISETEKKATDLLDFLVNLGAEEWRRSDDPENIKKAMNMGLAQYEDAKVISMTRSLAKRGRLTLPGDEELTKSYSDLAKSARNFLSAHNVQRLSIKKEMSALIRNLAITACEDKLKNLNEQENTSK